MNSVALPASASTPVLSAEADLVRQAARGDADAFGELYRRHSAPAWRLSQAVTADRDSATSAFQDGFVRAVRSGRFPRRAGGDTTFRPQVLAAVYRAAIDQAYDRTAAPAPARRSANGPDAALADAAFRSLPERWRAALWLGDVENLETDRIAAVLGVSTSVAEQLVARGRRGLAGRFSQAHRDAPEHIGEVLRPLTLSMPANLQDVTTARWSTARGDHTPVLAPVGAWLEQRATRPMSVAVGALIGLGLIGLGVVPGGSPFRSQLGAANPSSANGAVPVQTCLGLFCPSAPGGTGPAGAGLVSFSPTGGLDSGGSYLTAGGAGGAAGSGGSTGGTYPGYSTGSSPTGGSPSGGGTPPPGGGGTTTVTLPGSPVTTAPSPVTVPSTGTIGVPNLITLSPTSSGGSVNLLGGTATATTGTGGTSVSLSSPTSSSTTSTTSTTLLQGVTGTVSNTVSGTTSTVTSVVGTLSSGL
ncbi:MAG TPA: RNA polymerase sigma factor [Acidimicrobiales bacterium]|nr:RNA polymerase sigma factor [Acidimicrobiales bacterium]